MKWVDRGGAEGSGDVPDCSVLSCAKLAEEASLTREPDGGGVGEDGEDYRVVDGAPLTQFRPRTELLRT
jgi:hypothetical protein